MRPLVILTCTLLTATVSAPPAVARIGESPQAFAQGPLIFQLQLTYQGQQPLAGGPLGRVLYRYVSDDGLIIVDAVVRGGVIEQQVMYVPLDMRRGGQVSFFLQDALGSVVGAQRGLLAFRAAVSNRTTTTMRWGAMTVRFAPLDSSRLQVLAWR